MINKLYTTQDEQSVNICMLNEFNNTNIKEIKQDIIEYFYNRYNNLLFYNSKFKYREDKDFLFVETLLKCFKRYKIEKGTSFKSYLTNTFRFLTMGKNFNDFSAEMRLPENFDIPDKNDFIKDFNNKETLKEIITYIKTLGRDGDIFYKRVIEGKKLKEIATEYNMSMVNVKHRTDIIRNQLKVRYNS